MCLLFIFSSSVLVAIAATGIASARLNLQIIKKTILGYNVEFFKHSNFGITILTHFYERNDMLNIFSGTYARCKKKKFLRDNSFYSTGEKNEGNDRFSEWSYDDDDLGDRNLTPSFRFKSAMQETFSNNNFLFVN